MSKVRMDKQTHANLVTSERNLTQLLGDLDKLEECGFECQGWRDEIQAQVQRSQKIRQHFGPNAGLLD